MPLNTLTVIAAATPTVVATYFTHYLTRAQHRHTPLEHLSYHEGVALIRRFLAHASHHTVEQLQAFTAMYVPRPAWVRTEDVEVPAEFLERAGEYLERQLGEKGLREVGGRRWWKWREGRLRGEWVAIRDGWGGLGGGGGPRKKAEAEKQRKTVLYAHGGAYYFGSVDEHRYLLQRHARKIKARVFAPRYRLAPQFPFPCAIYDILTCYLYLLSIQPASSIIIAGDSAGGGLALSVLCILRDQGIPLPAGGVLISPWVDLCHSFPSVIGDNSQDYLPTHGFQHKPSAAWPPPNASDLAALESPDAAPEQEPHAKNPKEYMQNRKLDIKAAKGFVVVPPDAPPPSEKNSSVVIDDVRIRIDDQIQMYTTNALISHPLVSPILQSSLGGLCPLFILSGGGEVLRDEQIYLAHKAAYPEKHPTWEGHVKDDPRQVENLERFKTGTKVLLQVWEGCCHVVPALAWTRPAKKMFREVAKFSQWAFEEAAGDDGGGGRAQPDVDTASLTSSASSTSTSSFSSKDAAGEEEGATRMRSSSTSQPLLDLESMLTAFSVSTKGTFTRFSREPHPLPPDQIGVLTPEPVKRWMEAKKIWDERYAKEKRRVQRRRMKEMVELGAVGGGGDDGERPPPSAVVGRKKGAVNGAEEGVSKSETSWGLSMWAGWGGKHDKRTVGKNGRRVAGKAKGRSEAGKSEENDEEEEMDERATENMRGGGEVA